MIVRIEQEQPSLYFSVRGQYLFDPFGNILQALDWCPTNYGERYWTVVTTPTAKHRNFRADLDLLRTQEFL